MYKLIGIAVFILGFSFGVAAHSESGHESPHGGKHEACAKDVETHCAGVTPGKGAIKKCLKDNESKLTSQCGAHIKEAKEAMKEGMKDVKEACHEDVQKLCGDVKPGGGRIIKCMKEHHADLSAGCKAEVEKQKEARKKN